MSHTRHDVACKFGTLAIIPTDANHIYVTSNPEGGRNLLPFVIRNVEYTVSAHCHRYKDGSWYIVAENEPEYSRIYHSLFISRRDRKDTSSPARATAAAEILFAVREWVAKNGKSLTFAEYSALESRLDSLLQQKKEKLKEIEALDAHIKDVKSKLAILR